MLLHDGPGNGQPQAYASVRPGPRRAVEAPEQPRQLLFRDPPAVVFNGYGDGSFRLFDEEINLPLRGGMLAGILEDVAQRLAQPVGVAAHGGAALKLKPFT